MMDNYIKMATPLESWMGNGDPRSVKTIVISITEECNLACKYCYMTGKNNRNKISFETAKRCIDYILDNRKEFNEDSVVWEFIGGEPLLEIELIDKLCDYIKLRMFMLNHPWFDSYRFNFSTNGILYETDRVQEFIKKNKAHLSIGMSVDGNKVKHNLQRVYPNGKGSYDDVIKSVPLWIEQFPGAITKATFSHDDIPHLKDSIISLWENGIKNVAANVVFEDVWEEGDDLIFEEQLNSLGDYILENKLYDKYYVRFFEPSIGNSLTQEELDQPFCGTGKMLAIDCKGNFFPCIRFLDFSMSKRKGLSVGSIDKGIQWDKLRPFGLATCRKISNTECIDCEVASGCAWCSGSNYDEFGTIFKRSTYICKMHKANVRANKSFWNKYENITGNQSPRRKYESINDKKFLQILMDDGVSSICCYEKNKGFEAERKMTRQLLDKATKFAKENNYELVPIGEVDKGLLQLSDYYVNILSSEDKYINEKSIVVYDNNVDNLQLKISTAILLINKDNIKNISVFIKKLSLVTSRINLILKDIINFNKEDIKNYAMELDKLVEIVEENYSQNDLEINVLTDKINYNYHCSCDAGKDTILLAPDGNIYPCLGFYFDKIDKSIGNIDEGLFQDMITRTTYREDILCDKCEAYQCKSCKYINKKYTGEYGVSPKNQCIISNLESNKSEELKNKLIKKGFIKEKISSDKTRELDLFEIEFF